MFSRRAPQVLTAMVIAAAALTGCTDGDSTATPTQPAASSTTSAAPTQSASPSATATSTVTTTAPQSTVTAAPGLKATDKAVIARYGQKDADLALATARMIGYKMSPIAVLKGEIKGDDVLNPLVDVMDAAMIERLKKAPKSRDSLAMGNLPYTVLSADAPRVTVGQAAEATLSGNPVVTVPVTVEVLEKTKEYGDLQHTRFITVVLERQSETSEGTWRMTGFTAKPDALKEA